MHDSKQIQEQKQQEEYQSLMLVPEAPIGEVAGVTFCVFRPREWDGAGGRGWGKSPEGPGSGPGGVSLWGEVRGVLKGVVGWEVGPPANRASRLRRICTETSWTDPVLYSI